MNVQDSKFRDLTPESSAPFSPGRSSFRQRTAAVAAAAATEAEAVDHGAHLPQKAIDAARKERLLGAQIPIKFGGDGASISEIADICYALGRACASAGMSFAMHQTKVACLIRHGIGSDWHERFLRRMAEQLLLASSTTEGQNGGNIRFSSAAVERAQLFVRKAARASGGQMPPAAAHFAQARMSLAKLRALIAASMDDFARHQHVWRALNSTSNPLSPC